MRKYQHTGQRLLILWITLFAASLSIPAMAEETHAEFAAWKERLLSRDPKIFDTAVAEWQNGFARDAKAETLVPLLIPIIQNYAEKHEDESSRGLLMECMATRFGTEAKLAMPTLITLASDENANSYLRIMAVEALGKIGEKEPELIDALVGILKGMDPNVKRSAAEVLGNMDQAAESARPALHSLLEHQDVFLQDAAYMALGKIALEERAQLMNVILTRLDHVTELTAEESAAAFLEIEASALRKDPQAQMARKALVNIITSQSNTKYQRAAIRVLKTVGPGGDPAVVQALLKAMVKDNAFYAADLLKSIDATNPAALHPLIEAMRETLSHENSSHHTLTIAETLQKFGTQARTATPLIIQAMQKIEKVSRPKDPNIYTLAVYIRLLKSIGSVEPSPLPALLTMIHPELPFMKQSGTHADPIRHEIFQAIAAIGVPRDGPLHKETLIRVIEALQSKDIAVLVGACEVAGQLATAEVTPHLLKVVNTQADPQEAKLRSRERFTNLYASSAAMKALGKLGSFAKEALPRVNEIAKQQAPEPSFAPEVNDFRDLILSARDAKVAIEKDVAEKAQQQ